MKNKVMNFDKEELDDFFVSDYFSKNIFLSDEIEEFGEYLQSYKITDNDKLERISFELYGTTDYWDILLLLNSRDPIFGMPYEYDIVSDSSTNFIENFIEFFESANKPLTPERLESLTEYWENQFDKENELKRFIQVVRPSRMGDFLRLLKDKGYV